MRHTSSETTRVHSTGPAPARYAGGVGCSSVHSTANCWRMRLIEFEELNLLDEISGTGFADWPLDYEEMVGPEGLEPSPNRL